jgi:pyridoxal 5'-phosphate synthase pdxS subunit
VNLDGVFNMCRNVVEGMSGRSFGRIVNLSSVNGQTGQFGQTNYSAAKAGVHGFGMALARETARKGITVNTVSPGYCDTALVAAVPADIRAQGGVARMAAVAKIREIQEAVSIPVMAKVRIGHFVEAQILEALGVDFIDESEVLTPADESFHIDKHNFKVPFVCGARDLGEALRRIGEGATLIRTKGEAGSGNIVEAVRHMRSVTSAMRRLTTMGPDELMTAAKELGAPYELVRMVAQSGRLPVPNFAAGGVATPADAALMMQLGSESVFVGSGIFKSADPPARARAIVMATTHFKDPQILARVSDGLGEAMAGLEIGRLKPEELLQARGW